MKRLFPLLVWAATLPLAACGDDTGGVVFDGDGVGGQADEAPEIDEVCAARYCGSGSEPDTERCACCDEARTETACVCVRNRFAVECDETTGAGTETDTTDTTDTGEPERPVVTGCATDTRPSGQFGCTVDYGDGKGFVEAAYCVPSDPGVKPGDWGYRACGECSKGIASPAIMPGVWKGTATLDATSKATQQILGSPVTLSLTVAVSNAPGAALDLKISDPRALRSSVCIDTESERTRPGQAFDGWTTVLDPATGAFRATLSGVPAESFISDNTGMAFPVADILIEGVIASDQCVTAWMRVFVMGLVGCPGAVELVGPVALALTALEESAGVPDAATPCLDLETAAQPGPGSADPFVPSHCPSAPAYKAIIDSYDNPVDGGKGWPTCEGRGYCDGQ